MEPSLCTLPLFVSFMVLTGVPTVSAIDPCSHFIDAKYVNGKCFVRYDLNMTFDDAQLHCESQIGGGTLAEPRTNLEFEGLRDYEYLQSSISKYYIGLTERQEQDKFRWLSSSEVADISYMHWWLFNPDNFMGQEDCVEIIPEFDFKINDKKCSLPNGFICQQEVPNPCQDFLPGSELFDDRCFLIVDQDMSRENAQQHCWNKQSILAEPKTSEVMVFLQGMADRYYVDPTGVRHVQLGGSIKANGDWVWMSSGDVFNYTYWDSNHPANSNAQPYVVMSSANAWRWRNVIEQSDPFICQRDIGEPCEGQFPGAVYSSGQCWKFFGTAMNFDNAQAVCNEHGAFLAEPKNKTLYDALVRYLTKEIGNLTEMWLGGTDQESEGVFKWVTSGENFTFNRWGNSEPNNRHDEDHLLMNHDQEWIDVGGELPLSFVCQKVYDPNILKTYVTVFPSSNNDGDYGVLHITSGLRSRSVYLTIIPSDGSLLQTSVSWSKSLKYRMNEPMTISSTDVASKYVRISASESVTVVLIVKQEESMGSALLYSEESAIGMSYFIPTWNEDELQDDSSNFVAVIGEVFDKVTNVTIFSPGQKYISCFAVGQLKIWFRNQTTITGVLNEQFRALLTTNYFGPNGAFVLASEDVNVLVGSLQDQDPIEFIPGSSSSIGENLLAATNLDSVLPVQLAGKEYITFPSLPVNFDRTDTYEIIAIHKDTVILIYDGFVQENVPWKLANPGDFVHVNLPAAKFNLIHSDKAFYIIKFSDAPDQPKACMTSLFPQPLWRYQYDVFLASDIVGYQVYIIVIVNTEMTSLIHVHDLQPEPKCDEVAGTSFSGCYFHLPTIATYHIYLTNHEARFGAYLYASKAEAVVSCHALGYQDTAPITEFDTEGYLAYYWSDSCKTTGQEPDAGETSTTTSAVTTTETYTNITYYTTNSPSKSWELSKVALQEAQENAEELGKSLLVDAKSTSAFKRTKISVEDKRVSSTVLGVGGIAFVVAVASLLVCFDLCNLVCRKAFNKDDK